MILETNYHMSVIGFTGSGKTVFSNAFMRHVAIQSNGRLPILILDTKLQDDFRMFYKIAHVHRGNTLPPKKWYRPEKPFLIWQPETDDMALYDGYFKQIYESRVPSLIYNDEVSSFTTVSGKPPRYFDILLKQGRGMGIGLVNVTQSPSFVPPMMLRLTTYWLRFMLNDEYDLQKIASRMGRAVLTPPPDPYGFWFRDVRRPVAYTPPVYFKDYQEFFK